MPGVHPQSHKFEHQEVFLPFKQGGSLKFYIYLYAPNPLVPCMSVVWLGHSKLKDPGSRWKEQDWADPHEFHFLFGCTKHNPDIKSNKVLVTISALDPDLSTDLAGSDLYSG